ncbi:MAG: DNA mismatch repair protein MutS [Paramuribaculum sp.]|nr:DNA mismatch repair protein MutS [Paramuribaculum sp.]
MAKKIVETPLMKQYFEMKAKHPDAVLLFRVGDFYETFSDDAITASEILGITLTRRANGAASSVELAGFPHHALDTYLPRLVRAGKRVAICEQLEDPKLTKKLVKRGITELITPGISMNDNMLDHRENNFLAAIHQASPDHIGVAFLDISTGEFLAAEGNAEHIDKLIANFAPKEILTDRNRRKELEDKIQLRGLLTGMDDWVFNHPTAMERLLKQFQTQSLKGFGIDGMEAAVIAAGAVLYYLDQTQHTRTGHIVALKRIDQDRFVRMDNWTVRNLELVEPLSEGGRSLLSVVDRTVTPMGARMLRRWLLFPLLDAAAIKRRHDVVERLTEDRDLHDDLKDRLKMAGDLERLAGKVSVGRVTPREMIQLRNSLLLMAPIRELCTSSACEPLEAIGKQINDCRDVSELIGRTLTDDPPAALNRGGEVIRSGVNAELDELREIAYRGKDYLMKIQMRESEATGIPSLKVGFNNVFGYYIEVTNTHKNKVPDEWIRKQTLVNAERYITPELKEYEEKILGAQERIAILETKIYSELVTRVGEYVKAIQLDASMLGRLDCLAAFATDAKEYGYVRPNVNESLDLELIDARHPVIERELPAGEPYITNTVRLSNESTQIMMITGPNMSGKSALLRQTALNVLLAQCGSFVAATDATIGVVDRIFTRVGASDNIARGESTFMVEMTEAASILNNMTQRSLILFDELGRGTSTYDGISIARAIVEHIHETPGLHPKTLFATHYHELNELEGTLERVANFNVSVREIDGKVVFLRKLAPGGSEHSFGIHVARLAGMPVEIVKRAEQVLRLLEKAASNAEGKEGVRNAMKETGGTGYQMSFFQLDDPVLTQIRDEILSIDINNLTPVGALTKLNDIKQIITGK